MSTEHPIITYEQRLATAQLAGDLIELDRLLADDVLYVGLMGELGRKQDDLALYRTGRFKITRMNLIARELKDLGTTIVVISLMDTAAEIDGSAMSKVLRYTRVWSSLHGEWQVIAAHLSEVLQPA